MWVTCCWQHGWRAHSMHLRTRERDTSPHTHGGHSLASCMVRGPETMSRAHAALAMRGTRLGLRNLLHTEGNGTHPCMRLGHTSRPHAHTMRHHPARPADVYHYTTPCELALCYSRGARQGRASRRASAPDPPAARTCARSGRVD
jgi:hypothetical protein